MVFLWFSYGFPMVFHIPPGSQAQQKAQLTSQLTCQRFQLGPKAPKMSFNFHLGSPHGTVLAGGVFTCDSIGKP